MHTITSPHGTVNRIVIFRKNGVQAMVEYLFICCKQCCSGVSLLCQTTEILIFCCLYGTSSMCLVVK